MFCKKLFICCQARRRLWQKGAPIARVLDLDRIRVWAHNIASSLARSAVRNPLVRLCPLSTANRPAHHLGAWPYNTREVDITRTQLLKRLEGAWQALLASYDDLSEAELLAPGVTADWSVRDVIAHVTWWEEEALAHLLVILAGGRPPRYSVTYGGIDAFNELMMEQRRHLPLAEVLRQRDEVHARLVAFLEMVPEEQIAHETRFRRRLRLDTYGHYRLHTKSIRQWREQAFAQ